MRKTALAACIGLAASSMMFGCANGPPPLTYLASEKPTIPMAVQQETKVEKSFSRGGWYFGNNNFRPAPDVGSYVREAEKEAKATVLRNADVELGIPFAFDILFFGYNGGTDVLRAGNQAKK